MSASRSVPERDEAAESVRKATRELLRAAATAEPEAIDRAIDRRAEAVRRLERILLTESGPERKQLLESLAMQAGEAEVALRRLASASAAGLRSVARGARALRGYATYRADPSALDRSG